MVKNSFQERFHSHGESITMQNMSFIVGVINKVDSVKF